MKNKIIAMALSVLFALPCMLRAEEIVIQLREVINMSPMPGDDPLDGNDHMGHVPTRPNDFCATIDGHLLSVVKQNDSIPSVQAMVVNASTGGIVLNQQFTNSLQEQISTNGVYVLHLETAGGALVGNFIVQ